MILFKFSQTFFWRSNLHPMFCQHVCRSTGLYGTGRHWWKLRACKHSNFHRKSCSSGCHGCSKLHPFHTRPSAKRQQPKHFHAARCAWKAHHPLDPDGWKWWKTKQSLSSHPKPIPHWKASSHPQPVPHWKVATKHPLVQPFVPNLSTDFILSVPDYPN